MINLKLPDGKIISIESPISAIELAEKIAKSLAKKAVAVKINGEIKDLRTILDHNADIEIITIDSQDGLEVIRHDAAHVLAQAVKSLFPETQVTIGPVIENGFYYDFYRQTPFNPEDLKNIEKKNEDAW